MKTSEMSNDPRAIRQQVAPASANASGLIARACNAFWMAPLSGITDVCFRRLMDEMGAGVLVSELVSAKGLIYASGRTRRIIDIDPNPVALAGIQLFGESAEDIIAASRQVEEVKADFLDINLGCPVPKVVKKGCGAALMRDPSRLGRFLETIKKGVNLPLTVKMRTGWDANELTIHECVQAATDAGCEWVAIHGRTRAQGYTGLADWDLIREVKNRARIPIIGNGDICDAQTAHLRLRETGVDAVMIGRGALRRPWIFKECTGEIGPGFVPDRMGLIRHYRAMLSNYDTRHVLIHLRKFIVWISHGYPGSAAFRGRLFTLSTAAEVMETSAEYFAKIAHLPLPGFEESEAFMMGGHG